MKSSIDKPPNLWYNSIKVEGAEGEINMVMNPKFNSYMKAQKYSEHTKEDYTRYINSFLDFINKPENEIDAFDIMDWMGDFGENHSSATVNLALSAVKAYFEFLEAFDFITKNPAIKVKAPKINSKPKHYMDAVMVHNMISACKTMRDRAIVTTYALTGMRVSELTGLSYTAYMDMKARGDNQLLIIGKGDKPRYIVFNKQTQDAIDAYLNTWNGPRNCDNLFLSMRGNVIARNNLNVTLKTIAKNAGIPFWQDISNHALRSASATMYAEAGMPIANLRDFLGHASIKTTNRYVKASQEVTANAVLNMNIGI